MFQMVISIIFLCLILIPILILFIAFYENLLETVKIKQNIPQKRELKTSQNTARKVPSRAMQSNRLRKTNVDSYYPNYAKSQNSSKRPNLKVIK